MIAGLGAIGLSMCNLANLKLPRLVIGPEVREERAEMAKDFGADVVLNPAKCHVAQEIACPLERSLRDSRKKYPCGESDAGALNCLRNRHSTHQSPAS